MTHANLELLLSRLEKVKRNGDNSWTACCPAHGDKDPSLAVGVTAEGKVLLKCFVGCKGSEIMESLGLPMSTLFHPDSQYRKTKSDFRQRLQQHTAMSAIAKDAMVVGLAAAKLRNGESLSSADISALIDISARNNEKAAEVMR